MGKKVNLEQKRVAKQQEILSAARKLLSRQGAGKVSAAAIAKELGWTTPGLYYYYPGLEGILDELLKQLLEESLIATWEGAKRGSRGSEGLIFAFEARVQYDLKHPKDFELIWRRFADKEVSPELLSGFVYPKAQGFSQWLAAWLEAEKATGEVGKEVDCRKLVNLMIALAQGIVSLHFCFSQVGGELRYTAEELTAEGKRVLLKALRGD